MISVVYVADKLGYEITLADGSKILITEALIRELKRFQKLEVA